MNATEIQTAIQQYSSITRLMITLGLDAFKGIKALIKAFHTDLAPEQMDAILAAVKANSENEQALAEAAAGKSNGGTLGDDFTTATGQDTGEGPKA